MTLGATTSYAAPENAAEMTNVDINAKPEQYEPEPEPAKGATNLRRDINHSP